MCERISRPIESESRNEEKNKKKNVPIKKQPVAAKGQTPDIQRRINAAWLRLWKTVWPNIPPPVKVQSLKSKVQSLEPAKSKVSGLESKVQSREERRPAGSRSLESKVQSLKR